MPSAAVITTLAILAVFFWLVSALTCVDYRSRQSKQLRLIRMSLRLSCSQTIAPCSFFYLQQGKNKHLPRPSKWLNVIERETVLLLCVLKIEEITAGKCATGSIGERNGERNRTCAITLSPMYSMF